MVIIDQTASRRAVLGSIGAGLGLAVAPAFARAPVGAHSLGDGTMNMHTSIAHAGTKGWDGAVAALHEAEARDQAFYDSIYLPAKQEFDRRAPMPDRQFTVTAQSGSKATYPFDPNDPHAWDDHVCLQYREAGAALRGEWETYRSASEAAERDLRLDEKADESDALSSAAYEAQNLMLETPAPHIDAVLFKLDRLWQEDRERLPDFEVAIKADLRRLAKSD